MKNIWLSGLEIKFSRDGDVMNAVVSMYPAVETVRLPLQAEIRDAMPLIVAAIESVRVHCNDQY